MKKIGTTGTVNELVSLVGIHLATKENTLSEEIRLVNFPKYSFENYYSSEKVGDRQPKSKTEKAKTKKKNRLSKAPKRKNRK